MMIPKNNTYLDPYEFKKTLKPSRLYVVPIGGCGMFGMNMTAYILDGKMIIADAGSLFPDPWMLGVSIIIPDPDFWLFHEFDLLGYFITHAHEDHIGALPYMLKSKPAPIYTTPWTAEVLKRKFMEHALDSELSAVLPNQSIDLNPFHVKFIPIGHSIPDASSLLIKAGSFSAFHSGDFKFDTEDESIPDSLLDLKDEHLDLFLCDSTNSEKDGTCPQENTVVEPLRKLIKEAKGNIYLASFSSNIARFKWISDVCKDLGRKLYISGTSLRTNFELGVKMGLIDNGSYLEDSDADPVLKRSVVLISGCQGEYRSALARLANNEHRFFQLQEHDTVIFSSRTIPGNEKNISDMIDKLTRSSARIITTKDHPDIHVSGHAFGGEVSKLLKFAKPKTFVPVHGTYKHQLASCERNPNINSVLVKNGSILECIPGKTELIGHIKIDTVYVDDEYDLLLTKAEFLEKVRVAKKGTATLTGVVSLQSRKWVKGPIVRLSGLVKDEEWVDELIFEFKKIVNQAAQKNVSSEVLINSLKAHWENALIQRLGARPIVYTDIWNLD